MSAIPMAIDSTCPSPPSTSTQRVAYANVYRWDHSPSVLLSSSAPLDDRGRSQSPSSSTELTMSHHNRNARPPTVSVRPNSNCNPSRVAIPEQVYNHYYHQPAQDVRFSLNTSAAPHPSTATSHHGLSAHNQGPSVFPYNVSLNPSSLTPPKVFASNSELAAHYGIPQSLPKPPTTAPKSVSQREDPVSDFQTLSRNYLNMLSQKPDHNTPSEEESPAVSSTSLPEQVDMDAPVIPDVDVAQSVVDTLLASPEFRDLNEFLTSPFETPYDDFMTSPADDSPFTPDLNTPIMAGLDMYAEYGQPLIADLASQMYNFSTFGEEVAAEPVKEAQPASVPEPTKSALDTDKLYTFSPETPMLDSVNPASLYPSPQLPVSKEFSPTPSTSTTSRTRRSQATGTRKNITPSNLVPIDAPTQSRHYVTPSATSRKELPAVFARKRARKEAFGDEEDELAGEAPGPDASEREQIEWKRRQNTLAARKSRKRKLEHQQFLENRLDELNVEVEKWKTRSQTLEQILRSHGLPFSFEES
ncbi:hypothetical protein VKT23_007857 [Stygiomarasmius scandens]|uniref:BZIP domain-containing protein n=1 Tax=Marasmiellus scandens TaxID=2682957 RepID=A0ABR1JIL5_9AGAR